jgi:hypothetical protein
MKPPFFVAAGSLVALLAQEALAQTGFSMMRRNPVVMKALDVDGDRRLSPAEIANAATVLRYLDEDGDGVLSRVELTTESGFATPGRGRSGWGDMGDMGDWDDWDDWGDMGGRPERDAERRRLDPAELEFADGASAIRDRDEFTRMAYHEGMVMDHLKGLQFVKFQIEDVASGAPKLYFINTRTHATHFGFMRAIGGRSSAESMRGVLVHHPFLMAPSGRAGLYTYEFELEDEYSFAEMKFAFDLIEANSDLLRGNLAYHPLPRSVPPYLEEQDLYEQAGLPVVLSDDLYGDIGFLPLHQAESYGRLRLMDPGDRPGPLDVVVCSVLPNEMPRVAGVLSGVRQTPLSHVNLRAVQDDVPNAYVRDAAEIEQVADLIGKNVYYAVAADGWVLREATEEEVLRHIASTSTREPQVPPRNLAVAEVRPLADIGFDDADAFGVKTANLATLRTLGFPEDTVPDGFGVPFRFYDAFMRSNGLDEAVAVMLAAPEFADDTDARAAALKNLRKLIKKAPVPDWIDAELDQVLRSFPAGTSLRCRSSTNNEDLPGFSGAGLYDSFTHHPREGRLSKSVKQVYASLWNFRAYEERELHRIDHTHAAMGVLIHPNFEGELANGVAVTEDILYQTGEQRGRTYLVNAQVGEDMVTGPSAESIPEELLLSPRFTQDDTLLRRSNRVMDGGRVLGREALGDLRLHLKTIHREFRALYGKAEDEPFAMEVEFKVTHDGRLSVKQARPWVFGGQR